MGYARPAMSEDVPAEPDVAEAGPPPPQAATRGPVLRDAAPFVDDLPAGVRAQVCAAMGWPGDLGVLPVRALADPTGRAELADALAPHVVEQFPSTPLGTLLPVLVSLRDEPIPRFRVQTRLLAALRRPLGPEPWPLAPEPWLFGSEPCWAAVADRSVAEVRELRNVATVGAPAGGCVPGPGVVRTAAARAPRRQPERAAG